MDFEKELKRKKEELKEKEEYVARLQSSSQKSYLQSAIKERQRIIERIKKQIRVLEEIIQLKQDYENKADIVIEQIRISSSSSDYDNSFKKFLEAFKLTYRYFCLGDLEYNGKIVHYSDPKYASVYASSIKDILGEFIVDRKNPDENSKSEETKPANTSPNAPAQIKTEASAQIQAESSKNKSVRRFGGKHFKSDDDYLKTGEYVVFLKDGVINIVGNFSLEWLTNNLARLNSKIINENGGKPIVLWNELVYGENHLGKNKDLVLHFDKEEGFDIEGDIDEIEYYNKDEVQEIAPGEKKQKDQQELDDQRDYSGLDKIPDDLSSGAEEIIPVSAKKASRKKAKPSLLKRAKEKFDNLKTWQKVAIVAGAIAVVGAGIFVVGPHVAEFINNLVNPDNVSAAVSSADLPASTVSQVAQTSQAAQTASTIDYSALGGSGHNVFTNAFDAVNNSNGLVSNQWFSNNPVDVFNTATNSYMGLTAEQLHNPELLAELAQDPNNAMLFGNSISDPSGFMGLDEVVDIVSKVR